jgi:hypothetical protein
MKRRTHVSNNLRQPEDRYKFAVLSVAPRIDVHGRILAQLTVPEHLCLFRIDHHLPFPSRGAPAKRVRSSLSWTVSDASEMVALFM